MNLIAQRTERARTIRRILGIILLLNWGVAAVKLTFGMLSRSAAVTADGLHSFFDGSSNIIGLVAMSVAAHPPDEDHPYGHNKFEALAALGIGGMIGIALLELGRLALDSLLHGRSPEVTFQLAAVMGATLVVNVAVTRVESYYGRKLKSPLLLADARHTLSDVLVTLAVLSSLGLVWLGIPRVDGVVALVVMVVVAHVGYGIVRQAIGSLSDTARLDPDAVARLASGVPDVVSCATVRSRGTEDSVYVDLRIQVDPKLPTATAHEVAHTVERRLTEAFPEVVDVVVHVEPAPARRRP